MGGSYCEGGFTQPCACGCGENVTPKLYRSWVAKYIIGHSPIGRGDEWSDAEKEYLRNNYHRMTRRELGRALGRSEESVKSCAMKVMGLRKGGLHRTLEAHFDRQTPHRPADGCWLWQGHLTDDGYGVITCGGQRWLAHRLSVYLRDGRLARTADVLHRCDTKPCVSPAHLYVGGDSENQRDILSRTHRKGQRLTPDDVREIRRQFLCGTASKAELAKMFGCHTSNIHALLIGKSWAWVR